MKYKSLIFIITIAFSMMFISQAVFAASLPDIRSHWGESYIKALVEKGTISGMPDGKFYPDEVVTVPQFVRIIISLNYGDIKPVEGGDWASGYMREAVDRGLISPDELEADWKLTRFNAARIINNALNNIYFEPPVECTEEDEIEYIKVFEDIQTGCLSCGYEPPKGLAQTYLKGIISGKPGSTGVRFDGYAYLTRAEACVIIMRMIEPGLRTPPER